MKRWIALAALLVAPAAFAAPPRPKIAVMEVKAGQGLDPKQAATLTAILAADAGRAGLDVISQADIASMLAFQKQRQMLGCTDEGCLAELGGALGADWVLTGEAARVGTRDHVTVVLIEPKKAAVAARNAGFSEAGDDNLAMAAQARFRAALATVLPALVEKMPPIEPPGAAKLRARRTAAWWTLGAGGAVLAAGAGVGVVARSQANDLESSWNHADYKDLYDTQRRTAMTADVLMGAGLVTAGVGAWLYLTSDLPVVAVPVAGEGVTGLAVAGRF